MKHSKHSLFTASVASRTIWLGLFFSFLLLHLVFGSKNTVRGEQLNPSSGTKHSLLILATNHVSEAKLMELQQLANDTSFTIDYKLLESLKDSDALSDVIAPYQLVIFDSVSGHEAELSYSKFSSIVQASQHKSFLPIKLLKSTPLRQGISDAQAKRLYEYYDNGGTKNFRRMLTYLESNIFEKSNQSVAPPIIFPKVGIYHPKYEQTV
ncbi:MAG: cobaltochelatase subunit CobN, partial [Nitrospirales bacterium]